MANKTIRICEDAGHFGKYNQSPANRSYYESDMVWKLHLMRKKYLEEYEGVEVITTRSNQATDLELTARGRKAAGCDLFISDHSNAVGSCVNEDVDYAVVYHLTNDTTTKCDDISKELAYILAPVISEAIGTKQGWAVKQRLSDNDRNGDGIFNDNYYGVLHGARSVGVPGLILEHSFHTNTRITNWLLDDNNLEKIAKAEADAIAKYFGLKKKGTVEPTPSETPEVKKYYRVRKSWDDAKSQIGAYEFLDNAIRNCPEGYAVYDWNGKEVYSNKKAEEPKKELLAVDGEWGRDTTTKTQIVFGTIQDGEVSHQLNSCKDFLENCLTASWEFDDTGKGSQLIRAIQTFLADLGYYKGKIDGLCGEKTVMAIQAFLNDKGFDCGEVDGYMGEKTVKAWQKYINSRL